MKGESLPGFIATRLLQSVLSIAVVSVIVFSLVRLAGDPVELMASPNSTAEDLAALRAYLGVDQPLPEQYWRFVSHAAAGDFGRSVRFGRPALGLVEERLPNTLMLGTTAMVLAILVALPVGVYAAAWRGTRVDYAARSVAALGQAVPPFWLGLVLVLLFGVYLHWLPTSGSGDLAHLILPAITLGWVAVAGLMRLTRSSMLEVLGSEYVKLARVKGVPERRVIWKHAFRNAALPVLTFGALLLVNLVSGAVVVETVFAWPGIGSLVLEAVSTRDYPVVQTVVVLLSGLYIGANLIVDILYAYLNPRLRYT